MIVMLYDVTMVGTALFIPAGYILCQSDRDKIGLMDLALE